MLSVFAHSEVAHESLLESVRHWLDTPLNGIIVWLIISSATYLVVSNAKSIKQANKLLIYAASQLLAGFLLYRSSAALASLIISAAFVIVVMVTLLSLQSKPKGN